MAKEESWGDKIKIGMENKVRDNLVIEWALPYETLILGAMQGHCRTIYVDEGKNIDWNNETLFVSTFEVQKDHHKYLNSAYFELEDGIYYFYK